MSCCGQRRRQILPVEPVSARPRAPAARASVALFEYTGTTALTAIGPISGVKYRFASPGARLRVDLRDAPSLNAVPNLLRLE